MLFSASAHLSMDVQHVLHVLSNFPVLSKIEFIDCLRFIRFCCLVKESLKFHSPDQRQPPANIPSHIAETLASILNWRISVVEICWTALKAVIWAHEDMNATIEEVNLYNSQALN
ncbi:hypothetical protein Hypma_003743 [Hypsizygus marmoreus]|uniref:Uncharacterized protein n=1 Tax=Hypsizygus marmoreus TaxID=39966 RepID=A0A369J1B3_HYPMA|nr:hypothetical protein Hypma_003743 [Hypsizygus marmoreus]